MNASFKEFLATAPVEVLREKREWLNDYAGRTYNGHSEIMANVRAYDEEIARREGAAEAAPAVECICFELGATGPNQRHTRCRAHDDEVGGVA